MISAAPFWFTVALLAIVGVAALRDIRTYTIPNSYPIVVIVLFIFANAFIGLDLETLSFHVISALVALIFGFALFFFRLMGGGDVKLFAAIALWIPVSDLFSFAAMVTIAGGILSVIVIIRHWIKRRNGDAAAIAQPLGKARIPYGVAIFMGTIGMAVFGQLPL